MEGKRENRPLTEAEIQAGIRESMARRAERNYELSQKNLIQFGPKGSSGFWGPIGPTGSTNEAEPTKQNSQTYTKRENRPLTEAEIQAQTRKSMARRAERDYELCQKGLLRFGYRSKTGTWGPIGPTGPTGESEPTKQNCQTYTKKL